MSINIYDPILKKLTPVAGNNEATVASLDALSNVNISSPTDGQIIKFDEINNIWINANDDNAPMELGELSNVNLLSVSNGQILKYDATAEEWINADPQIIESVEDIPDVELTNLADGEFLVYDSLSEKWINTSLSGGYGIKISDGVISSKCFVGTTAEWEALSPIEQNEYTFVNLTDDYDEAREIDIAYVKELPLEGSIQDKFYGLLSYVKKSKVVADEFLDDDETFIKTTTEDGYIYTSDVVDVSVDDVDYVELVSLEYDGTKFILNGETDIAIGDTFYWKEVSDAVFYGGDSATQTFHTIEKTLVVDSVPTEESNNPVASGGVYTALQTKADSSSLALVATSGEAVDASYSHSISGLAADNVQDAIDELADEKIDATDVSSVGKASYVQINSINNQDVLQYNLSANKWKNSTALKDLAERTNVLGAKNLLEYPFNQTTVTKGGVTYTDNGDGTITLNGTVTSQNQFNLWLRGETNFYLKNGTYILSGCPSGGSSSTYRLYLAITKNGSPVQLANDIGNGVTFTADGDDFNDDSIQPSVAIIVYAGQTFENLTFKPMIRLASDTDDTWQPYAKTNQQLTEDTTALLDNTEVNGAVNMLPNSFTTQTVNGITFTVNDDGSITADGTATALCSLNISGDVALNGTYKMSGCPSGGGIETYSLRLYDSSATTLGDDEGNGKIISVNNKTCHAHIIIRSGQTVSDLTFKPMITVSSYNGDYVPYAKSNKQLTEDVEVKTYSLEPATGYTFLSSNTSCIKAGRVAMLSIATEKYSFAANTDVVLCTLPTEVVPYAVVRGVLMVSDKIVGSVRIFASTGDVHITPSEALTNANVALNLTYVCQS